MMAPFGSLAPQSDNTNAQTYFNNLKNDDYKVSELNRGIKWDLENDKGTACLVEVVQSMRLGIRLRVSLWEEDDTETKCIGDGLHKTRGLFGFLSNQIPDVRINDLNGQCTDDEDIATWLDKFAELWKSEVSVPWVAERVWYNDCPANPVKTKRRKVTDQEKHKIYSEQEGKCKNCNKHFAMKDGAFDHTTPLANTGVDAGPDTFLCHQCHHAKSDQEIYVEKDARLKIGLKLLQPFINKASDAVVSGQHDYLKKMIADNKNRPVQQLTSQHCKDFFRALVKHRVADEKERRKYENAKVTLDVFGRLTDTQRKCMFRIENKGAAICFDDLLKTSSNSMVKFVVDDQDVNKTVVALFRGISECKPVAKNFEEQWAEEYPQLLENNFKSDAKPRSRKTALKLIVLFQHHETGRMSELEQLYSKLSRDDSLMTVVNGIHMAEDECQRFKRSLTVFHEQVELFKRSTKKQKFDELAPYYLCSLAEPDGLKKLAELTPTEGAKVPQFFWEEVGSCQYQRESTPVPGSFWDCNTIRNARQGALVKYQFDFLVNLLQQRSFVTSQFGKYQKFCQEKEQGKKRKRQ